MSPYLLSQSCTKIVLWQLFVRCHFAGAVRVGIAIYSTEVQIEFNLNTHSTKAEVYRAIDDIPYIYGSTNTADALQTMSTVMFSPRNGDRPGVPNTCIILTDGVSNVNVDRSLPEARVRILCSKLCPSLYLAGIWLILSKVVIEWISLNHLIVVIHVWWTNLRDSITHQWKMKFVPNNYC